MSSWVESGFDGVVRLMAMAAEGALRYPVFNINDANTKHCFDNHYGTGRQRCRPGWKAGSRRTAPPRRPRPPACA